MTRKSRDMLDSACQEVYEALVDERTPLRPQRSAKLAHEEPVDEPVSLTSDPVLWMRTLSRNYSWRLLAMVVCTTHLLKGFVAGGGDEGLVGKPIEFLFGALGVAGGRLQILKAAAVSPWALKPVVALMSDALPIFGYKKMPYVVITTCLAFGAALVLGLGLTSSLTGIVACLFVIFLQVSSVDLLVVAKQSEEVKQKAHLGPQFFTFTWLGINFGQVASVALLGPMIYHFGPRIPYLLAAPIIALVLWPTLANFLGEQPVPPDEGAPNFKLIRRHPTLCSLTLCVGGMVIALLISTFMLSDRNLLALAVGICSVLPAVFMAFVRLEIAGPIVFYFGLGMLSFTLDGALFYFYTDTAEVFPAGPRFTAYFYTTCLGGAVFGGFMVGFITGEELFKRWCYRSILKVTILLRAGTQLLLVPVLLRWTSEFDRVYVLAVVLLDSIVFAWRWIPKQVMAAHLTPQGMETTMQGLTAGTFNLAMMLSSYFGGFILHHLGVQPTGGMHDAAMFSGIWKVQVVAALAPCLMLLALPGLIPAKVQTEVLLTERPDSATYGCPFERLSRREEGGHRDEP